jgi:hypothetical protein
LCLLLKPYGLKAHQLRPQDRGERSLADLELRKAGNGVATNGAQVVKVKDEGHDNLGYGELGHTVKTDNGEFTNF